MEGNKTSEPPLEPLKHILFVTILAPLADIKDIM